MQPDSIPDSDSGAWWQKPYRMVQTNLRQLDAKFDQRELARQIKAFGANVLLYNIGGIYAFYPTKLALQAVNPHMEGDALGKAIEAAHAEGLALVGRFDMSKATRLAYEAHPDWFVHNAAGKPLEYNGTYQACVNGGWYQDYAFRIIEEVVSNYALDGIFFNMFGYTNFTYSGDHFGMCTCHNCQKRFREMFGRELPQVENFSDPAYADYLQFQDQTSIELRNRIVDYVSELNPKIGITGHRGKSDLIRLEVQRSVNRPQPEWAYQAGDQARWGRAYGRGKTVSSTSTNFVDFAWRFHSESAGYHLLRFAQQLANGATLDLYLLGVLDQDDKRPLAAISDLFHWHAGNEDHYVGLTPGAKIALYHSRKTGRYRGRTDAPADEAAFRGAYRALVEERLPFDFVVDEHVEGPDGLAILSQYDAVVLPGTNCMSDAEAAVIDAYVAQGGTILATGDTGLHDELGAPRSTQVLECLPYTGLPTLRPDMRGAYFRVEPQEVSLPDSRLVMLDEAYYYVDAKSEGTQALFRLLPPQRFGPPELCFPDYESDWPGALTGSHGAGLAVYLPWAPDRLYYRNSLPSHRTIITDLIARNTPPAPAVLQGKGAFELTVQHQKAQGRTLVHVVNYSGQRNNLYEDAPEIHGLRLGVRNVGTDGVALVTRKSLKAVASRPDANGYVWFDLPPVGAFEAISLETK